MLRLYAGRENIEKERFVYESIKAEGGETFVLVPNQYTLAAEEQALEYLGEDCLFDIEILSMNRLGLRILHEQGTDSVRMLDKYGRFMLLTKIIKEHADEFEIFRRAAGKVSFTAMLNDFISEFKQQNCSEQQLKDMLGDAADYPLLSAKLKELGSVIKSYEEAIENRYKDPEDYISMYVDAIKDSSLCKGKSIWIYGYDSITPKFLSAMLELAKTAKDLNFVVNRSDFGLDEQLMASIEIKAHESGIDVSAEEIPDEYLSEKSETIQYIEKYLWSDVAAAGKGVQTEGAPGSDYLPKDLTMVCASNPYYEAENAAAYIWHLVRDLGYRMRDIQVIANDEGNMQPIIKRVFAEYGLPVFSDALRDITDTAAVGFIVNLLWFEVYHRVPQFLFAMLKSGMSEFSDEDIEDLENYVRNYHIKGSMWDRDFKYGEEAVGEDNFKKLNEMRSRISDLMKGLSEVCKAGTAKEFVEGFKKHLRDDWRLDERVTEAAEAAVAEGLPDEAQRLTQSYQKALDMLDQMVEVIGDEKTDLAEFCEIYVAGLSDVEVGVIPATTDGLNLGTMIRTRPRHIRAAVILGANEGVLPMQPSTEGLFSIDEKDFFKAKGFALGALDDIKMNEENAAMYRMMAGASEKLYISYSLTDTDGNDASPSSVIEALTDLFPRMEKDGLIKKDIISEGWNIKMINTPEDALRHLSVQYKENRGDLENDALTLAMLKWYRENRTHDLEVMLRTADYENDPKPLGHTLASKLFARQDGKLILSSSAIGNYYDCPFKYYVNYGLSPREEREFSTDSRSVGDAYHDCLMAVAERLLDDRTLMHAVNSEGGGGDAKIEQLVNEELDKLADVYRGGLFVSGGADNYRLERIREICAKAAKAMAQQLGAESVESAVFEEAFGRHGEFRPIELTVGEDKVYVEGRIDRADMLNVNGDKRVRVIDYKTGKDSLDLWKVKNGLRMQLMIYLISASTGEREPAGMFYFNIKDPIEAMNNKSKKNFDDLMERADEDIFKLKGAYINEEGVLGAMPKEVLSKGEKEPSISREEYEELRHDVLGKIKEAAEGILDGRIGIHPLREDNQKIACTYCGYSSICRRDGVYSKNYSRLLPKKPAKKKEEKEDKAKKA